MDIHPAQPAIGRNTTTEEVELDESAPLIRRDMSAPSDAEAEAAHLLAPAGHLFFGHLPKDLFNLIAGFASDVDIIAMSQVNNPWRGALDEPRRARPPVRLFIHVFAKPVTVPTKQAAWVLANRFVAGLEELPLRSRAQVARLMHRGTLAGVLQSHRTGLVAESRQRDQKANTVQANISGVLRSAFFIHGTGLMANGLAWAGNKAQGPAVWAYLASIVPSGLVAGHADKEAPGDSKQSARNHFCLMAAGVACAALKAISTAAFTAAVSELATEDAQGEVPQPSRYLPAMFMVGSALTEAALCGWAAWHSGQAMQGKAKVEQIDQKISVARATRATLTQVADGLRLSLKGIHDRIDITVEETVPGALAALAARPNQTASYTS